jgi:hypothetical protein
MALLEAHAEIFNSTEAVSSPRAGMTQIDREVL